MVKRQTVWLSTMMVLSLMLIGYYTVNTNTTTTTNTPDLGIGVNTTGTSDKTSVQTDTTAADSSKLTGSDYFAQLRMDAANQESRQQDQLTQIKLDTKASSQDVEAASQKLDQLNAAQAKIATLEDTIKGLGFKDAVIIQNQDSYRITVESAS